MKNHRQYEKRVKQNAIIIFLLAALLCGGMIYYIINAKQSINKQREVIKKNEEVLSLTNSFIEKINKAQSYANLYTLSGNAKHLDNFHIITSEIPQLKNSITNLCDEDFNSKTLNDIIALLNKKEKTIEAISEQLNAFNPFLEIYSIINNYQHIQNNTTVSKTIQDTIIYKSEKKNFFKRLSEVFNPDNSLDSIVLLSQTTIDTISVNDDATELLLNELQITTEKGRKNYIKQIETFERKYNNLTLADQEITKEISDLLINLHKYTLNSVIKEIQKSEIIINRNINVSILIAGIALLTIMTFIFFIFYDIKKVIIARKATEDAKKRTEEIMESRHKLLLSVSHDIKSPLSSILGYLELMGMDSHAKEEKRKITSMKNSADHILSLLTNLLNFSKLDQGKESLITSEFNISEFCDELGEMFAPLAKNKQLTFVYKKDIDDNVFIKSDALKIKQILSNILSNAIKYTINGKVHFIVSNDENSMTFNITDEGIGIPQDKLDEIFKPFSRIDNNESLIEGSGFGLFVVKGLVELLNGKINVNSEVGKGSSFTIKIPVDFVESIKTKEENVDINQLKSGLKLNALVVDDDKTLLTVIESMLNKLDIKCDKCQSSIEFENALKNINYYNLILTDREMGAFSGLDVLKKVKEINTDKKVVLMTARSEYNKDIAVEKGFDDYLRKPFSIRELASLLNTNFHSETKNNSRYQNDFPDLCSMFDNDDDITEILNTFVESTANNIVIFNEIINDDNFTEAVRLCHKMRPMFVQLNQNECADFLLKMDMLRGKDKSSFPEWKEEAIEFINKVDDLISYLYEKYGIE